MATPAQRLIKTGAMIGSALDFFTITATSFDISGVDAASQARLNMIVEVIAAHGQPVILDVVSATSLKFAIEHTMAWGADGSALETALNAAMAVAFPTEVTGGAAVTVAKAAGL